MSTIKDLLILGNLKINGSSIQELILDISHPIGSYYWSSDSTNPHDLFGGTWTQITDKFIYAAGSKSVNSTGGSESISTTCAGTINTYSGNTGSVTLSVSQIPSHNHTYVRMPQAYANTDYSYNNQANFNESCRKASNSETVNTSNTGSTGSHAHSFNHSHSFSGGSISINKMPPYIVAYCWKRTA